MATIYAALVGLAIAFVAATALVLMPSGLEDCQRQHSADTCLYALR